MIVDDVDLKEDGPYEVFDALAKGTRVVWYREIALVLVELAAEEGFEHIKEGVVDELDSVGAENDD